MNQPILFLDIDGVLNSAEFARRRRELKTPRRNRHHHDIDAIARFHLDPNAVARVNAVVQTTRCAVVMSSAWRVGDEYDYLRSCAILSAGGIQFDFLDRTPHLGTTRGVEIKSWLDGHPDVSRFAIVDDGSDMHPLSDRLVQTDMRFGIQAEHMHQLVSLLGDDATHTHQVPPSSAHRR